jgi:hypothetical protein
MGIGHTGWNSGSTHQIAAPERKAKGPRHVQIAPLLEAADCRLRLQLQGHGASSGADPHQ